MVGISFADCRPLQRSSRTSRRLLPSSNLVGIVGEVNLTSDGRRITSYNNPRTSSPILHLNDGLSVSSVGVKTWRSKTCYSNLIVYCVATKRTEPDNLNLNLMHVPKTRGGLGIYLLIT